ncbi:MULTISPECIES: hypothetical protein [unclassified Streptomyces]|uniref:hypothetical protein n=1 Tax=unclassified Streptomyces TaxID=2593676 RepID=UPI0029A2DCF3|nr:hypothetical protein [Streptomyces sp. DK15]MDX2390265.1 hypothetical protein [Streptomyces sp. DK15]
MAANHDSPEPEAGYDPAGSTQMFRAFVEEAAPARTPSVPGARRRQKGRAGGTAKGNGVKVAAALALLLLIGAALWLLLR